MTGIVIGLMSSIIFSENTKGGKLTTIILAMIGAVAGGFISTRLFSLNGSTLNAESAFVALTGAVIFSLLHRFIFKQKHLIMTRVTNL